jgi:hypothetical protein
VFVEEVTDTQVLVEAVLVVVVIDERDEYERGCESVHQLVVGTLPPIMRIRTVLAG